MDKKLKLVCKANPLIEASYRLSLMESRIIMSAIEQARETQKGLGEGFLTLEIKLFADFYGISGKSIYVNLKKAMRSLLRREISFPAINPENGRVRVINTHWVAATSCPPDSGIIEIRFLPELVPFISRLESNFTTYRLEKISGMKNPHAIRLYELLVQYLSIGKRKIDIAWLRETLLIESAYKETKDLKRYVIDVSVKQINEHSDIRVNYTQEKRGRTITHLNFEIKPEPKAVTETPPKPSKRPTPKKPAEAAPSPLDPKEKLKAFSQMHAIVG